MTAVKAEGKSKENPAKGAGIPTAKAKILDGKKGLVVGIANENSIAWGCAKAFRAFGAELAVTYLNDKAKKYVEPLARESEAPIVMPLDVRTAGQMEAVFERIAKDWGNLDFVVKDDLAWPSSYKLCVTRRHRHATALISAAKCECRALDRLLRDLPTLQEVSGT